MARRVRGGWPVIILPERIYRRVRACSLALNTTPEEVAVAGCRLFCTYVLREMTAERLSPQDPRKGSQKWQVEELVKVLASRFASRARK
jgi:hypothetical protein